MLAPSPVSPVRSRRLTLVAVSAAAIEWYDFFIYATAAALVFGKVFFPGVSPVSAVLASFATFGVGFAARPMGGVLFGHLSDRFGRKQTMVCSLLLMGASTTLIGLLPGYASIGVFAPFALIVLRICQGLAIGGQWGGAVQLAVESAPPGKRTRYGTFVQVGVPIGMVLGNTGFLIVAALVSPAEFDAWAWRVPFLLGSLTALLAYYIHRRVDDEYLDLPARPRLPIVEVVRQHPMTVLFASSVYIVLSAAFYILAAGLLDYGTRTLGVSKSSMLLAVLVSVSSMVLTLPLFTALSDRVGRKPVFAVGTLATGVSIFAVFPLIETLNMGLTILGLVITMTTIAMMYGPQAALFAEMFPAHTRCSGASLGYQIANVIGGGLAPFVMVLLLESTGSSLSVAVYIAVLAVIALVGLAFMRVEAMPRRPGRGRRGTRCPVRRA